METRLLTDIRDFIDGMQGHNYALPDCIKCIFERVGDYEQLDFWDIAAITGDTVAHVYNHNLTTGCEYCVSGYLAGAEYIEYVFSVFGYAHEYVTAKQIITDKPKYRRKIVEYIDKGVPVLVKTNINDIPTWNSDVGTYCLIIGYENDGNIVKLLVSDKNTLDYKINDNNKLDLIFIGEKQKNVSTEEIYIKTIKKMTYWLTLPECNGMHFGAAAFRKWADDVEARRFTDDNYHAMNWENYGVYLCNILTSDLGRTTIFKKLADINSKYAELVNVGEIIRNLSPSIPPNGGEHGLDMKVVREDMNNIEKRSEIVITLRNNAKNINQTVEILNECMRML